MLFNTENVKILINKYPDNFYGGSTHGNVLYLGNFTTQKATADRVRGVKTAPQPLSSCYLVWLNSPPGFCPQFNADTTNLSRGISGSPQCILFMGSQQSLAHFFTSIGWNALSVFSISLGVLFIHLFYYSLTPFSQTRLGYSFTTTTSHKSVHESWKRFWEFDENQVGLLTIPGDWASICFFINTNT